MNNLSVVPVPSQPVWVLRNSIWEIRSQNPIRKLKHYSLGIMKLINMCARMNTYVLLLELTSRAQLMIQMCYVAYGSSKTASNIVICCVLTNQFPRKAGSFDALTLWILMPEDILEDCFPVLCYKRFGPRVWVIRRTLCNLVPECCCFRRRISPSICRFSM